MKLKMKKNTRNSRKTNKYKTKNRITLKKNKKVKKPIKNNYLNSNLKTNIKVNLKTNKTYKNQPEFKAQINLFRVICNKINKYNFGQKIQVDYHDSWIF